jgi:hypothetical protein
MKNKKPALQSDEMRAEYSFYLSDMQRGRYAQRMRDEESTFVITAHVSTTKELESADSIVDGEPSSKTEV